MRRLSLLACLLLLAFGSTADAASDAQRGHRLAGVMSAGDSYVGFLELPQGASKASAPKTRSGGPPSDPQRTVTQRFAPLLDLPPHARVVEVNETRITSASAAIAVVEDTLAQGMPARLNLQTPGGMKRVYLMPAGTGNPPQSRP